MCIATRVGDHTNVQPTSNTLAINRSTPVCTVRRVSLGDAQADASMLVFGPLVLDLDAHVALAHGEPLDLSHLQFLLLVALVRRAGRLVTADELRGVAATAVVPTRRTVTSAISRVRRRLDDVGDAIAIEVVRGAGYRLVGRTGS